VEQTVQAREHPGPRSEIQFTHCAFFPLNKIYYTYIKTEQYVAQLQPRFLEHAERATTTTSVPKGAVPHQQSTVWLNSECSRWECVLELGRMCTSECS
jgi:hypothetical protein